MFIYLLLVILSYCGLLWSDPLTVDPPKIWEADCLPCIPPATCPPLVFDDGGITIDLKDPVYEDGVVITECGGVVTGPNIRIQAKRIKYTQTPEAFHVFCEGELLIEYKDRLLVGETLFFDFVTKTGLLTHGRTAYPPWYLGGDTIALLENGHLIIYNAYITTSEGEKKDVIIFSDKIEVTPNKIITAHDITLRVKDIPLMWLPKFNLDLKNFGQSPFAVKFGWGGFLGSHLSLRYHFLSWHELEGFARIDGFFGHGLGGGIETVYDPKFSCVEWYTRNYYAHDIAIDDPRRRDRYRFQGTYYNLFFNNISVNAMYDVVSDGQMAADYQTKDFDLCTAGRTQIEFRRQDENVITTLFARARVNSFQSVNQELPSFEMHWHPFEIGETGIIAENYLKAGYLDYEFSSEINEAESFNSARFDVRPYIYRPIHANSWIITPEAGFIGIVYSDSPSGHAVGQALGDVRLKVETSFHKYYSCLKHVVEPYAHYRFLTTPRVGVDDHYIFSIQDGWARLNQLRFGVRNSFFSSCWWRYIWVDLWANAFFDIETIPQTIPKGYLNLEWQPTPCLAINMMSAWNFRHNEVDFYNGRIEWTWSENLAFGIEYRHRGPFDWRKNDFYNFILEAARSEDELRNSILSDKRDTLLARFFLRYNPNWTAKCSLRYGWNRTDPPQKNYFEYLIEIGTIVFDHWNLGFIYEKREADNRYSMSLKLNPGPPLKKKAVNCF